MSDYKKHFQQLKKNQNSPKSKKMSLHYRTNAVKDNSAWVRWVGGISVVSFCLALYGLLYPEQLVTLSSRVKIGFLAQGMAAEQASSAEVKPSHEEKSSVSEKSPETKPADSKSPAVAENTNHVGQLLEKEKELVEREKRVVELEEKLQQQKLELDEKIKQLEVARRDIASRLETRVAQDQENIDKLVGVYSNMKPQSAAQVISQLDQELAISILRKMKKQDAGAIMNFMDPQKTKVLSEKYSGY